MDRSMFSLKRSSFWKSSWCTRACSAGGGGEGEGEGAGTVALMQMHVV